LLLKNCSRFSGMASDHTPLGYRTARSALDRAAFFRDALTDLPSNRSSLLQLDDLIPQFGYVGQRYKEGGVLLVGLNPGNGSGNVNRNAWDARMMPILARFAQDPSPEHFLQAQHAYRRECTTWRIWRHCTEIMDAGKLTPDEIAYSNCLPWRTGSRSNFDDYVADRAANLYARPLIEELRPSLVVCLGKRATDIVRAAIMGMAVKPQVIPWDCSRAATAKVRAERRRTAAAISALLGRQLVVEERPSSPKLPSAADADTPPDPLDKAFKPWLASKPRSWAIAIAARVALRVLPQIDLNQYVLPYFRAVAISRFAALHQSNEATSAARLIADYKFTETYTTFDAAAHAVAAAAEITTHSGDDATNAIAAATDVAMHQQDVVASVLRDAQALNDGWLKPEDLAGDKLWIREHWLGAEREKVPAWAIDEWRELRSSLQRLGEHWSVWIHWYEHVVEGSPRSEAWEAAFTDIPGPLRWTEGPETVNTEIARRLGEITAIAASPPTTETQAKLDPIEGVGSPITIVERPDGRIGVDGESLPVFPPSFPPEHHAQLLSACRSRADQLRQTASRPTFNGRSDYAETLTAYLKWLPGAPNTGNILLADGEVRVLNKLFTADQDILATGFASNLSVLLEDHIGLRAYYTEIERHYLTVKTGRLTVPLERDAVDGIQRVIRENTPTVFEESVDAVMSEAGKQVPEVRPPRPEDAPVIDPNHPRPPRDPIGEIDPQQSRNWIFASALNRIWALVLKGKNVHEAIEGWQQTYDQMKPYIGPVLNFLRMFLSSSSDGGPPMPPTIVT
jgi:hypothetical protein